MSIRTTVVGGGITNRDWLGYRADIITSSDDGSPVWQTVPITVGGLEVAWEIRFDSYDVAGQRTKMQFRGLHDGDEIFRGGPWNNQAGNCSAYGNHTSPGLTQFYDATFWGGTLVVILTAADAWRWSDL